MRARMLGEQLGASWRLAIALSSVLLAIGSPAGGGVLFSVPGDFPTIQAAIDAAQNGDTVRVAPGTYRENIDFRGKAIVVTSVEGPSRTVVDGGRVASVATFGSGEGAGSVLSGFTLRNGLGDDYSGGGIRISFSSPTISGNVITGNSACEGAGIYIYFGSPVIEGNTITGNARTGCSGGIGGGGIAVIGAASARILDNIIANNQTSASGGGIALFAAGTPIIERNVISGNTVSGGGGGISMENQSDADIVNNVIVQNVAADGGGIYWLVPSGTRGPRLVNNTIADNNSPRGSGIFADGFDAQAVLVNNIIVARPGQTALLCGDFNDTNSPIVQFNDVFAPAGTAYGGICGNQTGLDGNISADPLFANPRGGDYRIRAGSPAVDAGSNLVPDLPATDIGGTPRILDDDGNGWAAVNMGAYELESSGTGPIPAAGPTPLAGDFDGDGRQDLVRWNAADGAWSILESGTGASRVVIWGAPGDVPVPGDYDGDRKADIAVWRPATGTWFILDSSTGGGRSVGWGMAGDVPVPGDYDGDGRTDLAVWRPAQNGVEGIWYILRSSDGGREARLWGSSTLQDVPVPADYDGDGRTDLAVWRPVQDGVEGIWYILRSSDGGGEARLWGSSSLRDVPVPADYDGDGKADLAVWRPVQGDQEGVWFVVLSLTGAGIAQGFGASSLGDIPFPVDFAGVGRAQFGIFRASTGEFFVAPPLPGPSTPPTQPGGTAPIIANLSFAPSSAPFGGEIVVRGNVMFSDPDADVSLVRVVILASGQTLDTPVAPSTTTGSILIEVHARPPAPGAYTFAVQVFDRVGHASNVLTGIFTVTP